MTLTLFKIGFIPVTIMDVVDVAIMSYIIQRMYKFLRGTRGVQMLVGLIIILIVSVLAPVFQLKGLSWILENLRTIWLIAFVILFQPELRRILIYVGQNRVIRFFVKVAGNKVIEEVIHATIALRDRGYGALIVMARETGLRSVTEVGVKIQAEVTTQLILSIFNPRAPLHDGAVVIQNDVIEAAKCLIPISDTHHDDIKHGTRHKAALSLSEETDAMVIVVSEETGKISIAIGGEFQYDLDEDRMRHILVEGYRYGNTQVQAA